MSNFKELFVWQLAKKMAVAMYDITKEGSLNKDFGLRDQMRRAAVSIASNIAEGEGLGSNKQSVRHFYIARGSVFELHTQLIIAHDIGYIESDTFESLDNECNRICAMITKLIQHRME